MRDVVSLSLSLSLMARSSKVVEIRQSLNRIITPKLFKHVTDHLRYEQNACKNRTEIISSSRNTVKYKTIVKEQYSKYSNN